MSFQSMFDYDVRGVVSAEEMDKIRENIEYLHEPNYNAAVGADAGIINFTSTSWAKVSATYDKTLVTYGGPIIIMANPIVTYSGTGVLYLDFAIDGVRITDSNNGLWSPYAATTYSFSMIAIAKPAAGSHTLSLYARASAGTHNFRNSATNSLSNMFIQGIEI